MSSQKVGFIPMRLDTRSSRLAPTQVERDTSWFRLSSVSSRLCKTQILAFVAVIYLLVVFLMFNQLLFQQNKSRITVEERNSPGTSRLMESSEDVIEVTSQGTAEANSTMEMVIQSSYSKPATADVDANSLADENVAGFGNSPDGGIVVNDSESRHLTVEQVRFLYNANVESFGPPNYCVHIFYYPWYGSPEHDGQYLHWNHRYLPHWHKAITDRFPKGRHNPPDDIGASFYPQLGCYSSRDHRVIQLHMKMLRQAGIGVMAVSWFPPNESDDEGKPLDEVLPLILDLATTYGMKIILHMEPYKNRSAQSVLSDIKYMHKRYGKHPSLYKTTAKPDSPKSLPLIYIYDSYQISPPAWAEVFTPSGSSTIRGTDEDVIAIGLLTTEVIKSEILKSGFDGFYTYFAIDKFTYGSTSNNWYSLANFAREHNLLFIPSVGPGYDDTKVRPWNSRNTIERINGRYYSQKMVDGMNCQTRFLSITSFNEWHEGTQIEPAIPAVNSGIKYRDYRPHRPDYYLDQTRKLLEGFTCTAT